MVCARRVGVYAFVIGVFVCAQVSAVPASAKDSKSDKPVSTENSVPAESAVEFQWSENRKLTWDDFRGPVNAVSDESAAATHCGIGFKVNNSDPKSKPEIRVYNTFYKNKSWVRSDAKIASILVHEQGHFDLCEIYTRRLKKLMEQFDFNVADAKSALMAIFTKVNKEYEQRQQAYEEETIHGTNAEQQSRWVAEIRNELAYSR